MTKYAIYGSPRSGTKLLADCFRQNGYHNFGEFFDVYSSDIKNTDPPFAYRISLELQTRKKKMRADSGYLQDGLMKSIQLQNRYDQFKKYSEIDSSIVTVWPASLYLYPKIDELLHDRVFLCTRRDRYQRLLSELITFYNANYNEEIKSNKITVDINFLHVLLFSAFKTEMVQDDLVRTGRGRYVDFDKLINGQEDLGIPYKVTSNDQHTDNLENYIENLDEVKSYIEELNNFKLC